MFELLSRLFDPAPFIARRDCGGFGDVPGLLPLHLVSDVLIWLAYLAIPGVLVFFAWRRRALPFRGVFLLFGLFIVSCGFTHFMEAVIIYHPLYRLAGVLKLLTAIVSWATVIALIPVVPKALALRTSEELEGEIAERMRAERALEQERRSLERRVEERTAELEKANAALVEEIASRKKAQAERERLLESEQRARTEAENANRLKDEFLATLSHELRTPLSAMMGWTHLLREGKLDEGMTARGLEVLDRNTRAQAKLIDDLLDVSRIITGKLRLETRPVEMAGVVRAAADAIGPAASAKEVEVTVSLAGEPCVVMGDPTRLQQVAWNLLSNAVKFTPRGGRIEATLTREKADVVLTVKDDGLGVAPALLPHVFERFRQGDTGTTRKFGGLGLGLSIVRHLVELHGGTATAHSEGEGRGATFRVRLPLSALASGSRPEMQAVGPGSVAGLRVLVVDDEADAREMIAVALGAAGAEVRVCGSAREALEALAVFDADVLVSDIGMPGRTGTT